MFEYQQEGAIARILLNRGEKRNAITIENWKRLERLVHQVNDTDAQIIVFCSEVEGSFCAGSDLAELWGLSEDVSKRQKFRGVINTVMRRIRTSNKPTVALVDGGCFGIGVSLATACDIRVATADASFAITPAQFGMSYPQADLARLVQLVGPGQSARLVYGCERIDGREAHRIGLADILDLDRTAGKTLVASIAANSPSSLRALKAGLLNRFGSSQNFDACFGTPDFADRYSRLRAPVRNDWEPL